MNNFPFKNPETNETLWYSRSIAVNALIFSHNEETNNICVLAVKRGINSDLDEKGKWCLPCGYLDFNETCEEAVSRETFEETGLVVNPNEWVILDINSIPGTKKQNVSITYEHFTKKIDNIKLYSTIENEIDEIKWIEIPVRKDENDLEDYFNNPALSFHLIEHDFSVLDKYEWAFEHDKLIKKYI